MRKDTAVPETPILYAYGCGKGVLIIYLLSILLSQQLHNVHHSHSHRSTLDCEVCKLFIS